MKIIILLVSILLAGCETTFMDDALVGDINGRTIIIFKDHNINSTQYYRSQFQSDCVFSTGIMSNVCKIPGSNLSNIRSFKQRKI